MKYIIMLLFFICPCIVFANASLVMVDVSHGHRSGDALIIYDGDKVILIDCGREGIVLYGENKLLTYLQSVGVNKIDEFYISHPHHDHYGGVTELLAAGVVIKEAMYSDPPRGVSDPFYNPAHWSNAKNAMRRSGTVMHQISKGFFRQYDNGSMEVLFAAKGNYIGGKRLDLNGMSVVMRYQVGSTRVLFTGDLNTEPGQHLSSSPEMDADILKIPHHGLTDLAPNSFFDNVNPTLSLFTTSFRNPNNPRLARSHAWAKSRGMPYCSSHKTQYTYVDIGITSYSVSSKKDQKECKHQKIMSRHRPGPWVGRMMAPILDLLLE